MLMINRWNFSLV